MFPNTLRALIYSGLAALLTQPGPIQAAAITKTSKRGIAWADPGHPGDLALFNHTSKISWVYNWAPTPDNCLKTSGLTFVPMQWNDAGIASLASSVKSQKAKVVLGFNEPDYVEQSNMNATDAAALWKEYIQPLGNSSVRLGAPAVTNAPGGVVWLRDFFKACTGCKFDFIPIHWYGEGIGNFYDYVWSIYGEFGHPVWITEFASTSTNDTVVADFMSQTIRYLDTLDWVEKYAWFGVFRDDGQMHYNMLDTSGKLNQLGEIYLA
ncbi:glycoside hydrolase family 128 protein [Botryobasidium botryosum FD-172 SS1]|uniref:Glycoside hydrolase family 128 protein n=1 Tax=Botryobasidium botryosum (strain FD-172 SS1) TaxID=930990 RepID=A0A067M4Q1_BOTB1|nr:glycoside hydrolase family 128 protein [Botryobasidium botryosum FD-172 SS1]